MEPHNFGSPGRPSAESGTSDLCQSRQSGSAEAELQIFASQGRAEVRKRNSTFLAVNAERKCQSMQNESADVELQIFGSKDRTEAEFQIFGSQGRAEVRKRSIRSFAVKAVQKCGSGISDL